MAGTPMEAFDAQLDPNGRDESSGSLYDRVLNGTDGVLVVDREEGSGGLVDRCYEAGFSVSVDVVERQRAVPRVETDSQTIVGYSAISAFLADLASG